MSNSITCPACGGLVEVTNSAPMPCPYCGSTVQASFQAVEPASARNTVDLDEVKAQVVLGNKIEAIRLYRELTNVGLKEAKDAVEAIERGEAVSAVAPTLVSSGGSLEQIRQLARGGNKIEAIRQYRELTNVGLKEAKDAVEAMENGGSVADGISDMAVGIAASSQFANSAEMMDEVKRLLRADQKLNAVKVYREYFNCGLVEAKQAVDAAETELKFQAPPPSFQDDEVPSFARPEAASSGPIITPNPIADSGSTTWQKWAIGCSVAVVVLFCCLCLILPLVLLIILGLPIGV